MTFFEDLGISETIIPRENAAVIPVRRISSESLNGDSNSYINVRSLPKSKTIGRTGKDSQSIFDSYQSSSPTTEEVIKTGNLKSEVKSTVLQTSLPALSSLPTKKDETGDLPDHIARELQPWNSQTIFEGIEQGQAVRIWSRLLKSWVYWVLNDSIKNRVERIHPSIPVFTWKELELLVLNKCPLEHLQALTLARVEFKGTREIAVSRIPIPGVHNPSSNKEAL